MSPEASQELHQRITEELADLTYQGKQLSEAHAKALASAVLRLFVQVEERCVISVRGTFVPDAHPAVATHRCIEARTELERVSHDA